MFVWSDFLLPFDRNNNNLFPLDPEVSTDPATETRIRNQPFVQRCPLVFPSRRLHLHRNPFDLVHFIVKIEKKGIL